VHDKKRYRLHQKQKKIQATSEETFDMILNNSDKNFISMIKKFYLKVLILHQQWHGGRSVENNEWHNAYQHIRKEEWRALLGDKTESSNPLPKKFKIPKNSRSNREQLDEKTNTYVDMVLSKLRNLTLWRLAAFRDLRKKRLNARGFVREYLRSCSGYGPGRSVKRCGKSSSLNSNKFFCLGFAGFL